MESNLDVSSLDKYRITENGISKDTSALLHLNGSDASTTFTDETGKVWGAFGNAQLDTAQKVFGTASLLLAGTDFIYTAPHDDFNLGVGNFTIEARVRVNSFPTLGFIMSQRISATASRTYQIYLYNADRSIHFSVHTSGGAIGGDFNTDLSTGTWYHVAIVRNSATLTCYLNGTAEATTYNISTYSVNSSQAPLLIGNAGYSYATEGFNGWIDEFRISKVARWTSDFTPPIAEY